MRKLKLQVQTSVDGFMSSTDGKLDWAEWNWTEDIKKYVGAITDPVDCILLGRKLAEGFIPAWEGRLNDPDAAENGAVKFVGTNKIVFTSTLDKIDGKNVEIVKDDAIEYIKKLKQQPGRDIIVYGGSSFVSSLVEAGLIDEYNLFVNPAAIGKGLTIFGKLPENLKLLLKDCKKFDCGIVLHRYEPVKI